MVLSKNAAHLMDGTHVTNEEVFNRANTKPTLLDGLLTGFPWSPSKEMWHHTRPDDQTPTWNQTQRKTKNHLAEGPRYTSKHQLQIKEAITTPKDRKKWSSVGNPRRTPDE